MHSRQDLLLPGSVSFKRNRKLATPSAFQPCTIVTVDNRHPPTQFRERRFPFYTVNVYLYGKF